MHPFGGSTHDSRIEALLERIATALELIANPTGNTVPEPDWDKWNKQLAKETKK